MFCSDGLGIGKRITQEYGISCRNIGVGNIRGRITVFFDFDIFIGQS
jgi:hypothetical protein